MAKKLVVVNGATLRCSLGTDVSILSTTSHDRFLVAGQAVATVLDASADTNIHPFSMCSQVGGKCTPSPVLSPDDSGDSSGPTWTTQGVSLTSGGQTVLVEGGLLLCSLGGRISVNNAGQNVLSIEYVNCRPVSVPDGYNGGPNGQWGTEFANQMAAECSDFDAALQVGGNNSYYSYWKADRLITLCNVVLVNVASRVQADDGRRIELKVLQDGWPDISAHVPLLNQAATNHAMANEIASNDLFRAELTHMSLQESELLSEAMMPRSENIGLGTIVAWEGREGANGHVAVVTGWDEKAGWIVTYGGSAETGGMASRPLIYLHKQLGDEEHGPAVLRNLNLSHSGADQ